MKKAIVLLLTALMLLSVFAGCAAKTETTTTETASPTAGTTNEAGEKIGETIKIGVIAEISGQNAAAGKYTVNGVKLLENEIAAEGGLLIGDTRYPVEFICEDNEDKEDVTVNAMQKLINQENVIAVIGPSSSKTALAAFPIAQQAGVVAITSFGTNIAVTEIGDYCFRACFIDDYQGYAAAIHMVDEGYMKVGVLFSNADTYSVGVKNAFVKSFEEMGGEVVALEAYGGKDIKDFNVQLTKLVDAEPDALFFPNMNVELPLQIQQARQIRPDLPIVCGDSADNPEVLSLAGLENLDGVQYVSAFAADSTDPRAQAFSKAYEDAYGTEPNCDAVLIYEAGMMVIEGLKTAKAIDRASLRDAVANITGLEVPTGVITVGEDRNPVKGACIMEYDAEGQRHFLESINPE